MDVVWSKIINPFLVCGEMTNSKEFPSQDQFLFLFSWKDGGLDGTGKAIPGKIFFPVTFDGEILTEVIFVLIHCCEPF